MRRMSTFAAGAALVLTAVGCGTVSSSKRASPSPATRSHALTPVKIAVSAHSAGFSFMYVAKDLGIFRRYGLAATMVVMNPPTAIAALQSGNVQFMGALGSAARAAERGLPIRVVFVTQDAPGLELVAAPSMQRVAQLRHRVIAGESSASDVNALIYAGLLKAGLPPGSYQIVNAGSPQQQTALLVSGRAAATLEDQPEIFNLEQKGFHVVANFSRLIQIPYQGLATSVAEIRDHPRLVHRVIAASLAALKVCVNHPRQFEQVMEREFHMSSAQAKATWQFLRPTWTRDGRPSSVAVQTELNLDRRFLHLKQRPSASTIYDFSLLPSPTPKSASP